MRSLWIGTLAAALSCSTPGWSQMLQADRWIMVREEGKPAVKCRVVSTKKTKEGSTICTAKTESGETITLLEEAVQGMPAGTLRMRVLPGVPQHFAETRLTPVPTPAPAAAPRPAPTQAAASAVPRLAPTPVAQPTVVHAKPERVSLFGKVFQSSPSVPDVVTPVAKPQVVKTDAKQEPATPAARLSPSTTSIPDVVTPVAKPEVEKKEVVQVKPEPKKEPATAVGRFFFPTRTRPEVVTTVVKSEPVGKTTVELPAPASRPQLPVSTTSTDDPLSRPDLFAKNPVSGPTPAADPLVTPAVTTRVETKPESPPVPAAPAAPAVAQRNGVLSWLQTPAAPKVPVVQEPKQVTPSLLDRLRTQLPTATPSTRVAAPAPARPLAPSGMGSVLATRDRAIMGQSVGGAMVRTPTGAMAYVPADHMPQGPNVVPISASNAFTLGMPGFAPGMPGSMPMMAMQQAPVSYQQGVPEGAGNAFTIPSTSRPVPADMGAQPQYANAFLADGMGGAYTRPMALSYDPRMGYVPVAGGYPQQHPMLPMPHPAGQMLATLRGSIMPSERERAVLMLSQCNWHAEPEAVAAIVTAAKSDPAPSVRVSCVRALARMKVGTMPVYETLKELETDKDARVRLEAEQTLATMTRH